MNPLRAIGSALQWIPVFPVYGLLALAPFAGLALRESAPAVRYPGDVDLAAADTPVVLGYEALSQHPGPRSADRQHLSVEATDDGWLLGNVSSLRRVYARTRGGDARYIQRWRLIEGDRFSLPEVEFVVREVGPERLVIEEVDNGRSVTWNDGRLETSGEPVHLVCRSVWSRLIQRARWRFRNVRASNRPEFELFALGGGLNCSNRWR